jgi:hypothetical protein
MSTTLSIYAVIRKAVLDRSQMTCIYNGYIRESCPHAIGHTDGIPRVLVYQFAGASASGLPLGGEWRCMDISAMTQVRTCPGAWHTGIGHTKPQTCVKQVDLDITIR